MTWLVACVLIPFNLVGFTMVAVVKLRQRNRVEAQ